MAREKDVTKDTEALRALVAEVVAEKLEQKLDRKLERALEGNTLGSAMKAELLDQVGTRLGGALDVWTRREPGARRASLTRDEIAAAAVALADAEGVEAVSMRRIASELGVGTMTLYHYVKTKEELMTLVTDLVMGEVVLPDGEVLPDDWRDAITVVAHRSKAAFDRHPWMLDVLDEPGLGPNSVRHFDQSLAAVSRLEQPYGVKLDVVRTVDEYVFGFAVMNRNTAPMAADRWRDEMTAYVNGLLATGDYPQLQAMVADLGLEGAWAEVAEHVADDDRFERNLRRLLDGIGLSLGMPPA
ncbi:MAG TPA: TetR/AcrR family transcriptional regulator [Acidimicrobiales bacterium]|nr:TetR/AcrR family transcriptional regulator [Acidimicrobiales bacterium]